MKKLTKKEWKQQRREECSQKIEQILGYIKQFDNVTEECVKSKGNGRNSHTYYSIDISIEQYNFLFNNKKFFSESRKAFDFEENKDFMPCIAILHLNSNLQYEYQTADLVLCVKNKKDKSSKITKYDQYEIGLVVGVSGREHWYEEIFNYLFDCFKFKGTKCN